MSCSASVRGYSSVSTFSKGLFLSLCFLALLLVGSSKTMLAQSASVTGSVADTSKAILPNVTISLTNHETAATLQEKTNGAGIYSFPFVQPGVYTLSTDVTGFKHYEQSNITVAVGQKLNIDLQLEVGGASQSVNVDGTALEMNTTDASVSTVVDRQFIENIPLNGRSFQSLMTTVPGVSVVPSQGVGQSGEITVNGQRTESNQFTVDGVAANTGVEGYPAGTGAGYSGSTPGESVLGTTQSLVSIDALQEFRATTSTYSAEYGRTPGGQFTFNTRSGTNAWHGSLFDYFRNDALDANNWFNKYYGVGRQMERQNDFGGTLGGPIRIPHFYDGRDKTFFFFSYEGVRLQSPVAAITTEVPDQNLRENAPGILKNFVSAYPFPNGGESGDGLGLAYYTGGYSTPSSIDTTSIRIDHHFSDNFSVFARFSDSPSNATTRSSDDFAEIDPQQVNIQTLTLGATNLFTPRWSNEFRINGTWNHYTNHPAVDGFGGATPMTQETSGAPGITDSDWLFFYLTGHNDYPAFRLYAQSNLQRQLNVVDKVSTSLGRHQLKMGVDYRRLPTTSIMPYNYEAVGFADASDLLNGINTGMSLDRNPYSARPVYMNFSLFAQDEWKVNPRLSLSLGLRWDLNPAPRDAGGHQPYTVDQITNLATTVAAPEGSALWKTSYTNFAPRIGAAYQLTQTPGHETVLRAGFGMFYDTGNTLGSGGYSYGIGVSRYVDFSNTTFPLTQAQLDAIPPPSGDAPYTQGFIFGFDPGLKTPYILQWNVAVERALGEKQTFTASYVASAGRNLLEQIEFDPSAAGNPNFVSRWGLYLTQNRGISDYHSLQLQFQRKLSNGLQALATYTFAHAIDNSTSNFTLSDLERGSSDYDIRHNFQLALTYNTPVYHGSRAASYLLNDWAVDLRTTARSALPIDVFSDYSMTGITGQIVSYHPNRKPGVPLYVHDGLAPGGRAINFQAYSIAYEPDDVTETEGNAGRNSARGFDAVQQDIALRRDFHLTERFGLQFRIEAFNLLNHPIFGSINSLLSDGPTGPLRFGIASNTLNGQLGGLNSLYQTGGPRSLQAALKIHF